MLSKKVDGENKIINFTVYDPITKNEIKYKELCENNPLIVKENINDKVENIDSFLFLANQGIELSNPSSSFYTDLCFHYKSPFDGKDIPLKDRLKLFYPNVALCDQGCSIKGIDLTTNKSICECKLNEWINNEIIEGNKFLANSMAEIKTLIQKTNIEVLRCYKDLFHIKYYLSNHGSFIIMALLIIQIILTVIYYTKYIHAMRSYLYNITQKYLSYLASKGIDVSDDFDNNMLKPSPPNKNLQNNLKQNNNKNNNNINKNNNNKNNNINNNNINNNKNNNINNKNNNNKNNNNIMRINNKTKTVNPIRNVSRNQKMNTRVYKNKALSKENLLETKNIKINQKPIDHSMIKSSTSIKKNNFFASSKNKINVDSTDGSLMNSYKLNIDMKEYIKTSPDDMDYDNAIKRDTRDFCKYFGDNLKSDILILNIFCNYEPLNPVPIKCLLFILNIDLYFFVNGLFFTEDYLSELFEIKKDSFFELIDRFADRIVYITLIGIIVNYIADFFFYEERTIKKLFKREKRNILVLKYEMSQIIKNVKSRYNLFILICFIIAIFVWYYVFCFNNIYPSMKIEWIITSVIIIFVLQIIYFLKLLLESCIRFLSLKYKSEKLFKLSLFLK